MKSSFLVMARLNGQGFAELMPDNNFLITANGSSGRLRDKDVRGGPMDSATPGRWAAAGS
jgi:hypothetical protein